MKTQVEHLPNEVWLLIFSYLEAHDLIYCFAPLNRRFNTLLDTACLTFYLELKQQNRYNNQYYSTIHLFDRILKRIICLKLTVQREYADPSIYIRRNAHKLIQLQSLTITTNTINSDETYITCQLLQELPSYKYLSIICEKTSILISTILGRPTLRGLQVTFKESIWHNIYPLEINNNIERFYINFQGQSDFSLTNLLLDKMPNLKQFKLSCCEDTYFNPVKLFAQPLSDLSKLRTIKLVGGTEYLSSISLHNLQTTMPSLRQLHIDVCCRIMNQELFDHLFYYWWPILVTLEKIYIKIKGYIKRHFSKKVDYCWKMLLIKNKKSNNCFRIELKSYLETSSIKLTIIKK